MNSFTQNSLLFILQVITCYYNKAIIKSFVKDGTSAIKHEIHTMQYIPTIKKFAENRTKSNWWKNAEAQYRVYKNRLK